jgi:sialic acid synthase SpsE
LSIAKKLIDFASDAGFDAVKFQKRDPNICVPERYKDGINIYSV